MCGLSVNVIKRKFSYKKENGDFLLSIQVLRFQSFTALAANNYQLLLCL